MQFEVNYKPPGPVAKAFMKSDAFVRGIRGPIGSGTSSLCCVELFRRACQQAPGKDGKRRSRWVIVRNTYAELRETVIPTWESWFPPEIFGEVSMHPPPFHLNLDFNDIEAEFLFLALDRPEDVKKLLSLELTGGWTNETRELPKQIIDGLTSRLRRYPAKKDGGCTWSGLIMDTNSPQEDHWWSIMAGDVPPPEWMSREDRLLLVKPDDWQFFTQPAAMLEVLNNQNEVVGYSINPNAENIDNLDADYYPKLIQGKTRNWINVYVMNRIGADFDGRKVHPHFLRETHVSESHIPPVPNISLIGGLDFGLTPSCIFEQQVAGQWRILREIVMQNASAEELADEIIRVMARDFPDHTLDQLQCWGDPSGDSRVGTDKRTPFEIMRNKGINARPTETNDPVIRRACLTNPLKRMVDGKPGLIVSGPDCPIFVSGLDGGWHYPRLRGANGIVYAEEPAKNAYSHPCEAGEYGLQGGGEGRRARGGTATRARTGNARVDFNPLDRLKRPKPSSRIGFVRRAL